MVAAISSNSSPKHVVQRQGRPARASGVAVRPRGVANH
jgi:hypothetical protein